LVQALKLAEAAYDLRRDFLSAADAFVSKTTLA
jgi:hypothetical protein